MDKWMDERMDGWSGSFKLRCDLFFCSYVLFIGIIYLPKECVIVFLRCVEIFSALYSAGLCWKPCRKI